MLDVRCWTVRLPLRPLLSAIIPPGQVASAVSLPVAALRLAEEAVTPLRSLGIVQIAQLQDLPRESLQSRFGPEFIRRLDQVQGTVAEVIVARRGISEPTAAWPLEYPTAHRETLRQVLVLLIRRVAEPLAARGHGLLELTCQLDCSGQGVTLRVGLFQPTTLAEHLLELVDMQLELLRLPGAVSQVAVTATHTASLVERQHELFADEPREQRRAVGRAGRSPPQPPGARAGRAAALPRPSPRRLFATNRWPKPGSPRERGGVRPLAVPGHPRGPCSCAGRSPPAAAVLSATSPGGGRGDPRRAAGTDSLRRREPSRGAAPGARNGSKPPGGAAAACAATTTA